MSTPPLIPGSENLNTLSASIIKSETVSSESIMADEITATEVIAENLNSPNVTFTDVTATNATVQSLGSTSGQINDLFIPNSLLSGTANFFGYANGLRNFVLLSNSSNLTLLATNLLDGYIIRAKSNNSVDDTFPTANNMATELGILNPDINVRVGGYFSILNNDGAGDVTLLNTATSNLIFGTGTVSPGFCKTFFWTLISTPGGSTDMSIAVVCNSSI